MINLLKDSSTKISVQDKKIGELQKKIQNFEKKLIILLSIILEKILRN